jgi:hypothetical protein
MTLTVAEVFEAARALPREQRAELTEQLIGTLGEQDVSDAARYAALKEAVAAGIASLDAGKGVDIPESGLRDFLRERGRLASERVAARTG